MKQRLNAGQRAPSFFKEPVEFGLTRKLMGIHARNRLSVAFRTAPGSADTAFGLDMAQLA